MSLDSGSYGVKPVGVQVPPFALADLAHYRADEPYLTVDKCAARCMKLSVLLTTALARGERT